MPGLLVGGLLFAASLTPSLVPRIWATQGIVSGFSIAIGYAIGAFAAWLSARIAIPGPGEAFGRAARVAAAVVCAAVVAYALARAAGWQNSIRVLMELPPLDSLYTLKAVVALAVFAVLLVVARSFRCAARFAAAVARRFLPGWVASIVGLVATAALFWSIVNGVLVDTALRIMDAAYEERDSRIEPEFAQPTDPLKAGSQASLLSWKELGRRGRQFIVSGPTRAEISAFSGKEAMEPVRVYVGLRSADTVQSRARLALEELKRVGGFERSALIVVTPTGTGWIDDPALDSVEYLHGGDVASVAVQYSYVGSWLNHLSGSQYGFDTARALFEEIHAYWAGLPPEHRPRLYLYGLSLGAQSSTESTEFAAMLGGSINGALWAGPPYSTQLWRFFTTHRDPGSPAWLPRFRGGSFVRFMNQDGDAASQSGLRNANWGPARLVFLQYASDAATFFEYSAIYRQPEWMNLPRGPDVSPALRWYPVVSFLQLLVDAPMAMFAPAGHGHVYAPSDYVNAWIQVTDVRGWSAGEIARLKNHLSHRHGVASPATGAEPPIAKRLGPQAQQGS
ncbi:MAG: alpha/beta-hydrolase family protein [Sphingomonas sp.]|uniref:alpha/beta hydrolase n=1 Tax=Sphingomonas sp. TaxID=28214 RepID=UPI001B0E5C29|nr:alpha/beta-hydrolase family protein [Sphingomonas sp.]MBO9622353.1 alpha/beta-hydrolase family protein [Sphingomonas sp.]